LEQEEEGVSLQDVIEEDAELEATASAVLGGSDDKACTYPLGYVKRQALFACATCDTGDQPAGLCLACSLECHNSHELYELYTKRGFRCDCGNLKFADFKCKLVPGKDPTNDENKYGQNFKGLYCSCHRPYPDEEDDVDDDMIQCVVCEDWFHGRHLGATKVPPGMEYSEMVCFDCTKRLDEHIDGATHEKNGEKAPHVNGASFWPSDWRMILCRCGSCVTIYKELDVEFLLEESDTVKAYEEKGRREQSTGLEGVEGMSRVHQIEMIHGFNNMKEGLTEFLKSFADQGKVVTADDIRQFFQTLNQKRRRLD
uniref:UBR-type domain-containing protein n=1 Tax=Ciona savignyi TaxID=51511 RepID=H2YJI1_CIOSA